MHLTRINYFNLLLALFPVSFIAGNLSININLALITLSTVILYNTRLFKIKLFFLDKVIIFFFLLIIFTGIINSLELADFRRNNNMSPFHSFIKSLLFLKYLFFYFCIRFLCEKEILNLKFFFISSLLCVAFVSFDLLYQYYFGHDIFGYKQEGVRKLGGPFDDELIAGSYLQRFSLFAFFTVPLFFKSFSKKHSLGIIFLLFLIVLLGIILSGNRFPLILFFFSVFLVLLFEKQIRKYLLMFLISFGFILIVVLNFENKDPEDKELLVAQPGAVKENFNQFYNEINQIGEAILKGDFNKANAPSYLKEFYSFYHTWSLNKFIGGGIKNFRFYCHFRKDSHIHKCNMHPHNYYLEILTETGVIGLINVLLIFFILIYLSFYKQYFKKNLSQNSNLLIPFLFLFLTEIFPIRSSGSFFTTGNAVYLFMLMGIIIGLIRRNHTIENIK